MAVGTIQFFVIVGTRFCGHLFALPNKIDLPQFEYLILQGIYYGWAALEILLPAGAIASAALAAVARHHNLPLWLATLAALCFIVMLIVSFIWTFPANHATDNWMTLPKGWEALRPRWEYSYAANAALALLALSGDMSVLLWRSE